MRSATVASYVALCASLACGGGTSGPGPDAGGCGAGCPQSCQVLTDCDGGVGNAICLENVCHAAGTNPVFAVAKAELPPSFGGDSAASLLVQVFSASQPNGSTLDCPTLISGFDAGVLNLRDDHQVNPLLSPYPVAVHLGVGQSVVDFEVDAVAGGPGRLLFVLGFLQGGDAGVAAAGCATYDALPAPDGGAPEVGLTLTAW